MPITRDGLLQALGVEDDGTFDFAPVWATDETGSVRAPIGCHHYTGETIDIPLGTSAGRAGRWAITGAAGTGKSVTLEAVGWGLCMHYSPEALQLVLIGSRRSIFTGFAGVPHIAGTADTDTRSLTALCRTYLGPEMARRARRTNGSTRPALAVLIDAYDDIVVQHPKLADLLRQAAALDIHTIVTVRDAAALPQPPSGVIAFRPDTQGLALLYPEPERAPLGPVVMFSAFNVAVRFRRTLRRVALPSG